jgi:hypothetical protein
MERKTGFLALLVVELAAHGREGRLVLVLHGGQPQEQGGLVGLELGGPPVEGGAVGLDLLGHAEDFVGLEPDAHVRFSWFGAAEGPHG